ncbi:sensor histidine kinase [Aneurinibacillus aneurinilyticus]|jgi:signal transduction histidine kinase|uniref:sensor histidine kinase n=1 Tax=Aneurinibacillus aneurinilyticus TaxID=1391 RepID=UPI0023F79BCC|nr:sensor histidine kinase [Aneurinibacillus aneurinilyticus]MCI1694138.1 sensor histidine kinase [Aneurinibacillus aneurinilyticus]
MRAWAFPLLALLTLLLSGCTIRSISFPAAINGHIDATDWNFPANGPIELNGEWNFRWKQFSNSNESYSSPATDQTSTIMVPSIWNGKKVNGVTLSGKGYATYTVTVHFNPTEKNKLKALYIPTIFTAYRLYINGEAIASAGTPGKNSQEMIPQSLPQVVYFYPRNNKATLTFHVSNFMHKKGGIWKVILLGNDHQITALQERKLILDTALASCLFIAGSSHLLLYALRRKSTYPLYFGLFCILIGARSVISGRDSLLAKLWPDFNWNLALQIEYLAFYNAPLVFAMFLHSMYPADVPRSFVRVLQILALIFSLITLVTPAPIYTEAIQLYYVIMLTSIAYMLFLLIRIFLRKREFSFLNASVAIFFLLTSINDILYYNQIIMIGNLTPLGLFLFVSVQSFIISVKFSRTFTEAEQMSDQLKELNNTLEEKVRERTQKLEYSLREMAQARFEVSALAERNRIAGEIHDIVGHTLTTIIVQIEAGKRLVDKNLPLALNKLDLSQELVRNGLNEIRRTVHMIKEDTMNFDLTTGLKKLIHMTEKHTGIRIEYDIPTLPELSLAQKKLLYHALQEGLTNGIRHGKSTQFHFVLQKKDASLSFILQDNGTGCTNLLHGFGLQTMEERTREINGRMVIATQPGKGCRLTITLPLDTQQE